MSGVGDLRLQDRIERVGLCPSPFHHRVEAGKTHCTGSAETQTHAHHGGAARRHHAVIHARDLGATAIRTDRLGPAMDDEFVEPVFVVAGQRARAEDFLHVRVVFAEDQPVLRFERQRERAQQIVIADRRRPGNSSRISGRA